MQICDGGTDKTGICVTHLAHDLNLSALFGSEGGHFRWRASRFQILNLDPLPPLAPAQTPAGRSRAIRSQSCEGTEETGRSVAVVLHGSKFSKMLTYQKPVHFPEVLYYHISQVKFQSLLYSMA